MMLKVAANDGLDSSEYDVRGIASLASRLADRSSAIASDIAAFDVALSVNTLRYLAHLHLGRADPRRMGFRVPNRQPHDFAGPLRAALAQQRIPALTEEFTPSIPLYRHIRSALTRYRTLAANPVLQSHRHDALPGGKERVRRLTAMVEHRRVDLSSLVTHRFALDDIAEAFEVFSTSRGGALKVALYPSNGVSIGGKAHGSCRPTFSVPRPTATRADRLP